MSLTCTSPLIVSLLKYEFREFTKFPVVVFHASPEERARFLINKAVYEPAELPCGQCKACRLLRSKDWAVRCMHESSLYKRNCFLTLTYDDKHLPVTYNRLPTLYRYDFTCFMKRLRYYFPDEKIRYFFCGEYGEQTNRPHFHAILFNFDFFDKQLDSFRSVGRHGDTLYESETLHRIWKNGHCSIGEVSFESCSYVARYIMKKVNGDEAKKHYNGRVPEFIGMSTNPGIGAPWFDVNGLSDCILKGCVKYHTSTGDKLSRIPKYYPKLIKKYYGADVLQATKIFSRQVSDS